MGLLIPNFSLRNIGDRIVINKGYTKAKASALARGIIDIE